MKKMVFTLALLLRVLSSYIQYLDIILRLEKQGMRVKVSDISGALALPRPGVTRTVKEMTAKGYLTKTASEEDGRVTYLTITEAGRKLWEIYDGQYFAALQPALEDIPDVAQQKTPSSCRQRYGPTDRLTGETGSRKPY